MMRWMVVVALLLLAPSPAVADAGRSEIGHPATGHDVHLSPPAIAADREGPVVAWMTKDGADNVVYLARPGGARTRVSPVGWSGESLHQAPGLAVGPGGEIYVTWAAARRPRPPDAHFVSDLQLSRSLDGGKSFGPPLRVTDDAPTSHSFEALAVAPDGTVLVAWIETRPGGKPHTYLARLGERGSRVDGVSALDGDETCVCCRVALAAGSSNTVAVLWRKVFPGDVRDMVLGRSRDGGRTIGAATRVHADDWRITACPHRGGSLALDTRGRTHAVWYTEGKRNEPNVLYAVAADGRRFGHRSVCTSPRHRFRTTRASRYVPTGVR